MCYDKFDLDEIDDFDGCYFRGDTEYKEEYVLPPLGRYIKSQLEKGRKQEDITDEEIEQFKIENYYKSNE